MEANYSWNDDKINTVRSNKLWLTDPKYFKRVRMSPSATIKMMMHSQSGVEKGINQSGKPIEVMGLLLGRPDTDDLNCIVITDAQPLPIEGFETRVIADDENVINYMIQLGDSNETTKKEKFCGWYHTHPFDVDVYSQCFLSSTDISTQLQWKRAEDPHGNPWLAIVIDPLRSFAKGKPELAAFRVFPPEYSSSNPDETPDGSTIHDDKLRIEKWGVCWNRYYKLDTSYYMSSLAQSTLSLLKNKFLWQNTLSSSPHLDPDAQDELIDKIAILNKSFEINRKNEIGLSMFRGTVDNNSNNHQIANSIASDQCKCCISQLAKKLIFS